MSKLKLIAALFVFSLTVMAASPIHAAWKLNFDNPPSITNDPTFNLSFTALSTVAADDITVEAFQNGTLIGSQTTTKPYGDSGFIPVNLSSDGTYSFYLVGDNGGDTTTTPVKKVVLDTAAPQTPTYNGQTQSGSQFTVSFTAASDSDTDEVAIYTSTSSTFTANDASRIGTVDVNPGETETFTFSAGSSQERFFAIQAFDRAGNFSNLDGDEDIEVTQGTVTQPGGTTGGTATTASTPSGTTTTTTTTGEEGEVEGVTTDEGQQETSEEADQAAEDAAVPQDESQDVLGAETGQDDGINAWLWIFYGVLAAGVVYLIANRDLVTDYIRRVRS